MQLLFYLVYYHSTRQYSNNIVTRKNELIWCKEGGPPHYTAHMDTQPTVYPDSTYTYHKR
jgi:hypothetical protein